jgi:hypothetical protein
VDETIIESELTLAGGGVGGLRLTIGISTIGVVEVVDLNDWKERIDLRMVGTRELNIVVRGIWWER